MHFPSRELRVLLDEGLRALSEHAPERALAAFDRALVLDDAQHSVHFGRAVALARLSRTSDAIETLERLLARVPDHRKGAALLSELTSGSAANGAANPTAGGPSPLDLALQALENGRTDEALQLIERADLELGQIRDLNYVRGICFIQLGRWTEAQSALAAELSLDPERQEVKDLLGQVETELASAHVAYPDEFEQIFALTGASADSKPHTYALFQQAKQLCEQNVPGNFVQLADAVDPAGALLGFVIKRYSKQPRWLYLCSPASGPVPVTFDLPVAGSVFELSRDVIKTLQGCRTGDQHSWFEGLGMVALVHLRSSGAQRDQLLNVLRNQLSEGSIVVTADGPAPELLSSPRFERAEQRSAEVWIRREGFQRNPNVPPAIVNEFDLDDPVRHGVVSQMSRNERFQLYYLLRTALRPQAQPLRFVEVGSYAGGSLLLSYVALRRSFERLEGFAVEPEGIDQFHQIMQFLSKDVSHLKLFSHDAAVVLQQKFGDGNLAQFMLIDGDHTYEGVRQDILDYYPLLAPGGLMLFHDYLPQVSDRNRDAIFFHHANKEPGIRQACDELMTGRFGAEVIDLPLLYPDDPTQTQAHLPLIPGVYSTIRAYRKPAGAGR